MKSRIFEKDYLIYTGTAGYDILLFFRFRAGIKDLEVMMQNVITSAFETVTTVEQGVEVLDVFMHLSTREVTLFLQSILF